MTLVVDIIIAKVAAVPDNTMSIAQSNGSERLASGVRYSLVVAIIDIAVDVCLIVIKTAPSTVPKRPSFTLSQESMYKSM